MWRCRLLAPGALACPRWPRPLSAAWHQAPSLCCSHVSHGHLSVTAWPARSTLTSELQTHLGRKMPALGKAGRSRGRPGARWSPVLAACHSQGTLPSEAGEGQRGGHCHVEDAWQSMAALDRQGFLLRPHLKAAGISQIFQRYPFPISEVPYNQDRKWCWDPGLGSFPMKGHI